MSSEFKIARSPEQIDAAIDQLRSGFAKATSGKCFFNHPDVLRVQFEADRQGSPLLVEVLRSGQIIGIAPFVLRSQPIFLHFSVFRLKKSAARVLTFIGSDVVLIDASSSQSCLESIGAALKSVGSDYDLVFFDGVDARGALGCWVQASKSPQSSLSVNPTGTEPEFAYRVTLPLTHDEYFQTLGTSTRKSLKKRTKALLDDQTWPGRMDCITSPAQVKEFVRHVDQIYKDTWQCHTYGFIERDRPTEIDRLERVAELGMFRSYVLYRGDEPIAFQIGYQFDGTYHAFQCGFARAWSALGPGAVLTHLWMMDLFQNNRPRVVDFCHGDNPAKHTFRAEMYPVWSGYLARGRGWHWHFTLQRWILRLEVRVRAMLTRLHLDEAVRRILKRKA